MILVDVTTIACLFIEGSRSPAARNALAVDTDWVSPTIWQAQLRDILSEHVRFHGMTVPQALGKRAAAKFALRYSHELLSDEDVLSLSKESGISASQATYILVARRLGATLVTGDSQIADRFPTEAVVIENFAAE